MSKKSYFISNYKVSQTTYLFVQEKLQGFSPEERRFILHILCSELLARSRAEDTENREDWGAFALKLPSKTIRAEIARDFSWKSFEPRAKGLLEASGFCDGSCRTFQVSPTFLAEVVAKIDQATQSPDQSPAVNLFDGSAYKTACWVSAEGVPASSKLMRDALKLLHVANCPINVDAVGEHLRRLERDGKPLALLNDKLCAQWIFAGMKVSDGFGFYTPSYSPQRSGRLGELGGGTQSCSKAMKEAAFSGIENLFNYDLRSSQGYVLLQDLRLAGIDDTWVAAHLGPGAFEQHAGALALSKGAYKKCFFATIMGASHRWLEGEHIGALQEKMLEVCGTPELARVKFKQVVKQLEPLKKVVRLWTEWLLESPGCPHRKKTQRREYLENATGQKLLLDGASDAKELTRKAAAHMLQGQEAAFIHHLTILSKDSTFTPISNQHDGLVTLGIVPPQAIAEAGKRSGFEYAFLDQKPFVSPE